MDLPDSATAHALLRGEYRPSEVVTVRWSAGRAPGDLVDTSWAAPLLMSLPFRRLLEDSGLTGWSSYPVELVARDGSAIFGYTGLVVTGRCGPFEDARCVPTIQRYPGRTVTIPRGIYVDPSSWDGSSFFCRRDGGSLVLCTEEARTVLESGKVKNVRLERATEVLRQDLRAT